MYSGLWTKNGEQILPSFISINAKVVDLAAQIQFTKTYSDINKYFDTLNKLNNSKEEDATFKAFLNTSMGVLCGFEINLDGKKITSQVVSQQDAMRLFEKNQADTDVVKEAGEFTNTESHIEEDFFLCKVNNLSQYKELEIIITYSTEMSTQGDYLLMEFPTSLTTIRSNQTFEDINNTNINNINNTTNTTNITPNVNSQNTNINNTNNINNNNNNNNKSSLSLSSSGIQVNQKQGLLIEMDLEMPSNISEIISPSHPKGIDVEYKGLTGKVTYKDSRSIDVVNQSDLVVLIKLDNPHEPHGFIEENEKGSRALMIAFYPQLPSNQQQTSTVDSELIFLVDVSESMEGYNIRHAKKALHRFLHSLQKDTLFNIISFASTHRKLFPQSVAYNDENLKAATQYVESLKAVKQGETNLLEPLKDIYSVVPTRSRKIFLLTDGRVNNIGPILDIVRQNVDNTSVFPIGMEFGSRQLVEYIANAGSGVAELVIENETIENKVIRQLKRALQPAISNIKIDWGALNKKNQAPRDLCTLFFGDRLVVYNILAADEKIDGSTIKLLANSPSGPICFPVTIKSEEIKKGNLVHSLAAYTLIQDLQDQIYENPDQDLEPIRQKIIDLGIKYGLASNYTSFCSVEEPEKFNDLLKKQKEEEQEKQKQQKEQEQKIKDTINSAILGNLTLSDKPNDNGLFKSNDRLKVQSESAMISLRSSASSIPTTASGSGIPFYNPNTSPSHSNVLNNNNNNTSSSTTAPSTLKTPLTPLSKSTLKVSSPEFVPKTLNANSTPFYPSPIKTSTTTATTTTTPAKPAENNVAPAKPAPVSNVKPTAAALIAAAQEQSKQVTTAPSTAPVKPAEPVATTPVKPVEPVATAPVKSVEPVATTPVKSVESAETPVKSAEPVVTAKPVEPVVTAKPSVETNTTVKPASVETTATTKPASVENTATVKPVEQPPAKLSAAALIAAAQEQQAKQAAILAQQQKEQQIRDQQIKEQQQKEQQQLKEQRQKEKQTTPNKKQSKSSAKQQKDQPQQQAEKSSSQTATAAEPIKSENVKPSTESTGKPSSQTVNSITSTLQNFGFQTNDVAATPAIKVQQPSSNNTATANASTSTQPQQPKPAVTNILPTPISTSARRVYNNDFLLSFRESNTKAPDSLKTTPIYSNGPQGISPAGNSNSKFGKKRGGDRFREAVPAQPVVVKKIFSQDVQGTHQELLKKFKFNLNRITMDTYSSLIKNIEELKVPDEEALKSISKILFEKAIVDQKYSAVYAILSGHLDVSYPKFGEVSLKRAILENCQNEFNTAVFDKSKFEGMSKEDLEEQEFLFKRRVLGNIKFIGELYKHNVLGLKITLNITQQLISKCEERLDEESIEPLVKLLTTIGKKLDEVDKATNDGFFNKIQTISDSDKVTSRGRFILLDLLDLRTNKWQPKNATQTKSKKEETEKEERFIAKHGGSNKKEEREDRGGRRGDRDRGDRGDRDREDRGGKGGRGRRGDRDREDREDRGKGKGSAFGKSGGKDGWETVGSKGGRGNGKDNKPSKKESGSAFGSSLFGGKSSSSSSIPVGSPYRPGQGLAKKESNDSPSRSNLFSALDSDDDSIAPSSPQQPSYFNNKGGKGNNNAFGNNKSQPNNKSQDRDNNKSSAPSKQKEEKPAPVVPVEPVKPKVNIERIEDSMGMTLDEYVETLDIDEAIECIKEINEPTVLGKQFNIFVMKSLERRANEKEAIIELFNGILQAQLFNAEQIKEGLQECIDNIEDIEVDLPFSGKFVAQIIAVCIETEIFSLNYLEEAFSHIVDSGKAEEMIVNTFDAIVKISNKDRLVEIYENTEGLDILKLFTLKNRKVSYLEEFYQTHFPYLSHEKAVEGNDNIAEQPEIIDHLLLSQTADGNWQLNKKLAGTLGVSLNAIIEADSSDSVITTHPDVWATCLVISYLKLEQDGEDALELVLDKSYKWLSAQYESSKPPKESKDEVLLKSKRLLSELL